MYYSCDTISTIKSILLFSRKGTKVSIVEDAINSLNELDGREDLFFSLTLTNDQKAEVLVDALTDEDIEAWHNGELTDHVEKLMAHLGVSEMHIWGSNVNTEPLSVKVIK